MNRHRGGDDMSESNKWHTGSEDGKRTGDKEKARDMVKRDTPDSTPSTGQSASSDDRDKVYRPDENVDNEKSPKARSEPQNQPFMQEASVKGHQAKGKEAHKRNIDDTSEDAESSRRDG
ncbi:MAG: hypothetical protein UMU75_06380 [Halomonas sp.]|nr:hypothetical protein [Halomonas sp.]